MVSDDTITAESYRVLERVPGEWWDEELIVGGIALALKMGIGETRRRLVHLKALGLVERRRFHRIDPIFQLWRVARG